MSMFIKANANITVQDSFQKEGFSNSLIPYTQIEDEVKIDWTAFISRSQMRRLSPVLKSAIACAMDCKNQYDVSWGAIVVGTGLGCIRDTEKFLVDVNEVDEGGLISPTAFIQSTHNTISGQISILTKNHEYNMTHSHRLFSLENSLIDAENQLMLGKNDILVGACEEEIPLLETLADKLEQEWSSFISGASSFAVLSNDETDIKMSKVAVRYNLADEFQSSIDKLIAAEGIDLSSVDLILNAAAIDFNADVEVLPLSSFFGFNMSLSAVGMAVAIDKIKQGTNTKVLIVNGYQNHGSLILLEACGNIG